MLLEKSRRNNLRDDITGLLLYHEGNFFQALEGPMDAVQACYDRIVEDPHHQGHIVLMAEEVAQRNFSAWSMAYVPYHDMEDGDRDGLHDLLSIRDRIDPTTLDVDPRLRIFLNTFLANFRL